MDSQVWRLHVVLMNFLETPWGIWGYFLAKMEEMLYKNSSRVKWLDDTLGGEVIIGKIF